MDTVLIIIIAILFGVFIVGIAYILYRHTGEEYLGKNEDIEKNIDRIGLPEGYKGVTDPMERWKIESYFPSLKLLWPRKGKKLKPNLSLLLKKKDEKKEIFLMDVVYYVVECESSYDQCSTIACFLQSLDTHPVKIFPRVPLLGKKLHHWTKLVNKVPGFWEHFHAVLPFDTQEMARPSIRLNPEIQKLLLDYYDTYTYPYIHRKKSDAPRPILCIGKDGICLEILQTSYKDNLTNIVQFVEQIWEIINKSDFICAKV